MRPLVRAFKRLAALFAVTLAVGSQMPSRAAAAENWDLYIYNPVATVAAVKGLNAIIEQIEKETGGELKIRLHLGGSLPINTTNITQAVSDDVVQMGDDGYFLGNVPIGGVLRLPMLIRSRDEYAKAATIMDPYLETAFGKKGLVVLGQYLYPFQVAYSRNKLTSLADFKGQKIRVTSPEQGEFIKRLGGVPVTLGAPEVPSALDRGVVDGVLTANTGGGNTWKDLLKFNYRLGMNYFNSVVIANKDRFAKLPPDVQAKVRKIVKDNMPLISSAMENEEDNLPKKFAEGGMTVTQPTAAGSGRSGQDHLGVLGRMGQDEGPGCGGRGQAGSCGTRTLTHVRHRRRFGADGAVHRIEVPTSGPSIVDKACEAVCSLFLMAMIVLIGAEAIARNVFATSLQITDEVGGYLLVAMTFLSMSVAEAHGAFHRVELVQARLSRKARMISQIVFDLMSLGGIGAGHLAIGTGLTLNSWRAEDVAPTPLADAALAAAEPRWRSACPALPCPGADHRRQGQGSCAGATRIMTPGRRTDLRPRDLPGFALRRA